MDIYTYIKKDHKKVSALFKDIISASSLTARKNLFLQLKQELELHADSEHKTFYAALQKSSEGKDDAEHGDKEHDQIKKQLAKIAKIDPKETVKWCVQLGELKHIVEHHVDDEESSMFDEGKKVISSEESVALVQQMEALKIKMKASKSFQAKYI